jgi:molybdate transport system regulatory protein
MPETRLTLRVDFGGNRAIGPGKVRLLEAIHDTGSISQAGRALGMSYRRAWLLVDDMNHCFSEPVIDAQPGGAQGGGAALTTFGRELVRNYRAIEAAATAAAKPRLNALEGRLRTAPRGAKARRTSIAGSRRR